jgi:hypothetical protein
VIVLKEMLDWLEGIGDRREASHADTLLLCMRITALLNLHVLLYAKVKTNMINNTLVSFFFHMDCYVLVMTSMRRVRALHDAGSINIMISSLNQDRKAFFFQARFIRINMSWRNRSIIICPLNTRKQT